jgi:hypothetical protein
LGQQQQLNGNSTTGLQCCPGQHDSMQHVNRDSMTSSRWCSTPHVGSQ